MTGSSLITLPIILITFVLSYRGFKDHRLVDQYGFQVNKVLLYKDYKVLLTSGFFHVGWFHLIFNMLTFYFFSEGLGNLLGTLPLLIIYFSGLVGGNLLALWMHRNHGDYRAVGASGAVYALIFASIALMPGMRIGIFPLPISIPTWIYGLLFLGFSMYIIRSKRDNIGHEAHLGGALIGMLIALLFEPAAIRENYLPILAVLVPTLAFIFIIVYKPHLLMVDSLHFKETHKLTIDQRFNLEKQQQQLTIDKILEKIHQRGMNSLTSEERKQLDAYSKSS